MTANPRETDFVVSDALDTEIARRVRGLAEESGS
jgi:hypothetical protein